MVKNKDYYEVLSVPRDAGTEDIKKAYRRLARKYHPDLHPGDKHMEARFKDINEAYAVLIDPRKRKEYDMGGRVVFEGGPFTGGPFGGGGGGGFDFRDFGNNIGGVEELFTEFFGGRGGRGGKGGGGGRGGGGRPGRARVNVPARGEDTLYSLDLDFLHAVKGIDVRISVRKGTGTEKLTVKIPPGVKDGSRVRVAGRGHPGAYGGPPGDLYIIPRVKPHPYFRRVDNDIYLDVPVTINEAVFGAKIEVPTIEGFATVKVPAGTQGRQKLRLKAKGVASTGGRRRGDQYIVINVAVPKGVDKKSKELLEEIARTNPYEPRRGLW